MRYMIDVEDNGNKDFATVGDLRDVLFEDFGVARRRGEANKLKNTKIQIDLIDIEGRVITGDSSLVVGWCGDRFIISGNIQEVFDYTGEEE